MPSIKLDLTTELAEKIERDTLDNGVPRAKVIQHAIEWYYSSPSQEAEQLRAENAHKDELLAAKDQENQELRATLEWLRGEYALATTKLLPAAEKTMTPWWVRFKRKLMQH
jgi:hypothetical protein